LASLVAGLTYVLVDVVGGYVRVGVGYTVLMAAALAAWPYQRKSPANPENLNYEWETARLAKPLGKCFRGYLAGISRAKIEPNDRSERSSGCTPVWARCY